MPWRVEQVQEPEPGCRCMRCERPVTDEFRVVWIEENGLERDLGDSFPPIQIGTAHPGTPELL